MTRGYHPGELEVQERAGVLQQAARIGGSIRDALPPQAQAFLEQRRFVVLATADHRNRPWASILVGSSGFAVSPGPSEVRLDATPAAGDPWAANLRHSGFAGLLAIDLATRRRMRVNGALDSVEGGAVVLRVEQAYSNCPKYIQRRDVERQGQAPAPTLLQQGSTLDDRQRDWIRAADTFFIATLAPGHGADASHRGGAPGFIEVAGNRLIWPDYAGNMMYNTLGNIAAHPWAGLAVPDFSTGAVLQLTGRAEILWDGGDMAGAERRVALDVEEVVEIGGLLPVAEGVEYSPFNPSHT